MPSTRLFLGGLSEKVNRQDVGEKLSHYGPILSIDLKEKTDPEGNILFRFAYVNVDAAPPQIEQCIQELNGTSWKGSHLRVERAKESFLDRLNRERAARQQEGEKACTEKLKDNTLSTVTNVGETESSAQHNDSSEKQGIKVSDKKNSSKRKDYHNCEKDFSETENVNLHHSDKVSQPDSHSHEARKEKKKKKHEVEEKMLSSFKKFSSVWAESDNESDEGDVEADHDNSQEEQQTEEKTVPPALEGNKYVKVAKDLSFGQNTSGFSLLAQFSRLNDKEDEKEKVVVAPVSAPRTLIAVQKKVKKQPFFMIGADREIEGAIEWMTQPITEEIIKEFEEALPDLRQVIRTRSFRAKKEDADSRGKRRGGRGRGRGRGQSRGRSAAGDTLNPYRDHRWRERATKK